MVGAEQRQDHARGRAVQIDDEGVERRELVSGERHGRGLAPPPQSVATFGDV
jgi:hypothetical protein